jgi:hypothetical protein
MSNWKEKRKQKRANTARAAQDKLDSLCKALKQINLLAVDIEDAYITRGARDPEDVDVLIQIVEINHEIMEVCNGALWESRVGLPSPPPGVMTITLRGNIPVNP